MDYLVHHGILGMKWGVRRYQNKDGSLTPAGQKRYSKPQGETKKLSGVKPASEQPKQRTIKDLSNEELDSAIVRLKKEKEYKELMTTLNPKRTTVFGNIASKLKNETVPKIVSDAVANTVGKFVEKYAGMKIDQYLFDKYATEFERSERSEKTAKNNWSAENYRQLLEELKNYKRPPVSPDKLVKK